MSQKIGFLLVLMIIYLDLPNESYAVGNLTSIPETSIPGILSVCPGDLFSLTCVHDNPNPQFAATFWQLPGVSLCIVSHSVSDDLPCGPFTVTMISGTAGPTLSSIVRVTAMDSLSGEVFGCLDGINPTSPSVGNITLDVLSVPVPSVSVLQVSQSTVQVNTSVNTTQCVGTYQVDVSREDGGSPSMSVSSTPQHTINDLDLCRYNYSFAASIISAGGESGNVSSSVSFTVDLLVLNGVNNVSVNQEGSLLQWDQQQNVNYTTCIVSYTVSWNGNEFSTGNTSATSEDLNAAGFPYCQNIPITVTPVTPMGSLTGVSAAANATLVSPEFVAPSIYGFYTLNITNTVNETTNITTTTEMIVFSGTIQNISDMVVRERSYGYSRSNMVCTPNTVFTGNSFETTLPMDATPGDIYTFCVQFVNNDCMEMASSNFLIRGRNITIEDDEMVLYSSLNFTTNLPITEYPPDQLQIIVSITPNDTAPVVANFPANYQYTVMLSDLMPGTSYIYTVRVVRRSDTTDVVDAFVGSFTTVPLPTMAPTQPPPSTTSPTTTSEQTTSSSGTTSAQGCTEGCIAGIIVGFLIVLVLVVVIIVVVLCYWSKTKNSGSMKVSSHEMGQQSEKLTPSHGDQVDPVSAPPTETFKNADAADPAADKSPDVIPGNGDAEQVDAGPDSNALIYADLEMATKDKNKAKVDATVTPTGGAEGHEAVEYASIEHFKKSDKSEGDEDN